jgi:glucose-6-phosphate isomerase
VGVYVQITTAPGRDLPIPGREFTFGDFIASQAGGDAQVLADHGRPVLRLHLTDHDAGLDQVTTALSRGGRG